jgi:hypothetical protein
MRRILAGLALALLIASPVLAKGGASIAAPDGLTFGDTFSVTFVPANGPDHDYWARADCFANAFTEGVPQPPDGIVYRQFVHLEPGVQPFTLGTTPSWWGGGADCLVTLISIDGGKVSEYAEDVFLVGP